MIKINKKSVTITSFEAWLYHFQALSILSVNQVEIYLLYSFSIPVDQKILCSVPLVGHLHRHLKVLLPWPVAMNPKQRILLPHPVGLFPRPVLLSWQMVLSHRAFVLPLQEDLVYRAVIHQFLLLQILMNIFWAAVRVLTQKIIKIQEDLVYRAVIHQFLLLQILMNIFRAAVRVLTQKIIKITLPIRREIRRERRMSLPIVLYFIRRRVCHPVGLLPWPVLLFLPPWIVLPQPVILAQTIHLKIVNVRDRMKRK